MKKVDRSEILDLGAYEQVRERFRTRLIETKKHRRLSVGPHMTFIWENRETVLFQIQEMLRTERITTRDAIQHEIDTYNELVPGTHELSATLMIEYDDPAERRVALDGFASLRNEVTLHVGERAYRASFRDQPGEEPDRLPAVNYLRFKLDDGAADALDDASVRAELAIENAHYRQRTELPAGVRKQLASDLREP